MDARVVAELHAARPVAERVCRRALQSGHAAEDCVSEAIAHALSDPSRLAGVTNIAGWLVTVSRRRAVDALRDEARLRRSQESMLATTCHVGADPADDVVDRHEAAWLVASASSSMPSTTWSVMELRSAGASVHDVASSLGLTERSVESHLLRARRYFKQLLAAAGAGLVYLRRSATRTPVAVSMVGVSVVLCLQPGRATPPTGVLAPTTQPVMRQALVATAHPARVAAPRARPHSLAGITRTVATLPKRDRVVASAGVVTVTQKDRGGSNDPLIGTLKCLSELHVDSRHIGC